MSLPSSRDPKLWLALLQEIQNAGGAANPKDIYDKVAAHFPDISDADRAQTYPKSGANMWRNRIAFARLLLVHLKRLDGGESGVWKITDVGRQWLAANGQVENGDHPKVLTPSLTEQEHRDNGSAKTPTDGPVVMVSDVDALCQRLKQSQRQFGSPENFELALTDSFTMLGFVAQHIGGAGDTDVRATARLFHDTYSLVVDAKSNGTGKVPEAQIDWLAIAHHRIKHDATFAAVVGEDFAGGNLLKFADESKVVLITTSILCDLLRIHAEAPCSLIELRTLFGTPGLAQEGFKALQVYQNQRLRRWRLIGEIVDTIAQLALVAPDGLKTDDLYLLFRVQPPKALSQPPTRREVIDAILLLTNPALSVLTEVSGADGTYYQLTMTASTARKTIQAFAHSLGTMANGSVEVGSKSIDATT